MVLNRKVIQDDNQKLQLILDVHRDGHEGVFKAYNYLKKRLLLDKHDF